MYYISWHLSRSSPKVTLKLIDFAFQHFFFLFKDNLETITKRKNMNIFETISKFHGKLIVKLETIMG